MIPDPAWKSGPPDEEEEDDTREHDDDEAYAIDDEPREDKAWDAVRDYEQELEREPW